MDTCCFVEIRVHREGNLYDVSTGYRISPRRYLTVAHVLYPEGRRTALADARSCKVEVRHNVQGDVWRPVAVAWNGWDQEDVSAEADASQAEYDACILALADEESECAQANTIPHLFEEPFQWGEFETRAFPKVARELAEFTGDLKATQVRGEVDGYEPKSPGGHVVEITVPNLKLPNSTDWSGASGFPVFMRGAICALVTDFNPRTESSRLLALPIPELLRLDKFCEAARRSRSDKRNSWRERVCKTLKDFLEGSSGSKTCEWFKDSPRKEQIVRFANLKAGEALDEKVIAEFLLTMSPQSLIDAAWKLYNAPGVETHSIERLLSITLPYVAERELDEIVKKLDDTTGTCSGAVCVFFHWRIGDGVS